VAGIDTYAGLNAAYAKDATNVEVVFKLAQKCADRYSDELTKRSNELYQKVLTMDVGGRTASYYDEDRKATIPYIEAAEFALAQQASNGRKPDPAPLRAFIAKHPASVLVKSAYISLSYYYGYQAKKEDAQAFFDEALAKHLDDKNLASSYPRASSGTRSPSTGGSPWPRSSKTSRAIRGTPRSRRTWPSSMSSRTTRPRRRRNTARTSRRATSPTPCPL